MRFSKNTPLFYCFIALLLILLDQLVKWIVIEFYPFLVFANRGVVFGWIENQAIGYALLALGFIVLIYLFYAQKNLLLTSYPLLLIAAGAVSNVLDRIFRGYIVDYINLFNLNIFNLADVFIVAGVLLYLITNRTKPVRN